MQSYKDYYSKVLSLGDKVLFASNNKLLEGTVDKIFENIIIIKTEKGKRYDFGYFDAKEGVIKLEKSKNKT